MLQLFFNQSYAFLGRNVTLESHAAFDGGNFVEIDSDLDRCLGHVL